MLSFLSAYFILQKLHLLHDLLQLVVELQNFAIFLCKLSLQSLALLLIPSLDISQLEPCCLPKSPIKIREA